MYEDDELCCAKTESFSLLTSQFVLFITFIISHHLYFTYSIFLSPYLLRIVSFLSPVFIITVLVSLAFLERTDRYVRNPVTRFLVALYTCVIDRLKFKNKYKDDEPIHQVLEDYGMSCEVSFGLNMMVEAKDYNIVPPVKVLEERPEKSSEFEASESVSYEDLSTNRSDDLTGYNDRVEEKAVIDTMSQYTLTVNETIKKKIAKADKVAGILRKGFLVTDESEAKVEEKILIETSERLKLDEHNGLNGQVDGANIPIVHSSRLMDYSNILGTYGSIRKEKEWNRTLACKLFEERHNGDGGEGMDSLWETYEIDSNKPKLENNDKTKIKNNMNTNQKKNKKKSVIEHLYEDEHNDEFNAEQLCCLQALKLSAGKMSNLGMGKPKLVKLSKAIKGIGWLHHVSKKIHNNHACDRD